MGLLNLSRGTFLTVLNIDISLSVRGISAAVISLVPSSQEVDAARREHRWQRPTLPASLLSSSAARRPNAWHRRRSLQR